MELTLKMLRELGACESACMLFEQKFGESVNVTSEDALTELCVVVAQDFNFDWAGRHLPSPSGQEAYKEGFTIAMNTYIESLASARKACDEAYTLARKSYKENVARAFAKTYNFDQSNNQAE